MLKNGQVIEVRNSSIVTTTPKADYTKKLIEAAPRIF